MLTENQALKGNHLRSGCHIQQMDFEVWHPKVGVPGLLGFLKRPHGIFFLGFVVGFFFFLQLCAA